VIKVLIADDEPGVLSSTSAVLKLFGYAVSTVSDAREIIGILRVERPDVLLQDVRMPGLDLAAHLKAIRSDAEVGRLPIILFTANLDADDVGQRLGADGVIGKPFDPNQLRDLIARLVGARGSGPNT
jgi:CheY-like chemotaxis protein